MQTRFADALMRARTFLLEGQPSILPQLRNPKFFPAG